MRRDSLRGAPSRTVCGLAVAEAPALAMHQPKMIISSGSQPTIERRGDDAVRVTTPLEAITRLERLDGDRRIRTVVLAGGYANNRDLERFLGVFYPTVRVEREK